MNIFLDAIHMPSFFSGTPSEMFGRLRSHFVTNMQTASHYMRYNELTLGGSVLGMNLVLLIASEKIAALIPNRFKTEFFQKPWVSHTTSLLFKTTFVGAWICTINSLLNLHVDYRLLALSVITSIACRVIWQTFISPEICLWRGQGKPEIAKSNNELLQKEILDDGVDEDHTNKTLNADKDDDLIHSNNNMDAPEVQELDSVNDLSVQESQEADESHKTLEEPVTPRAVRKAEQKIHDLKLDSSSGVTESTLESDIFNPALEDLRRFSKKKST